MKTRRIPAWLILWITLTSALIGTQVRGETNRITGYLYGSHNWVATNTYILTGFTYVMSNAVLNIEAGTVVKGASGTGTSTSAANDFGCLFVCSGGKLNANGTPNRPIIFTAVADDVSDAGDLPFPTRGLWGGIVLFGNARLNNPGWTTNNVSYDIYEGLPDLAVTNAVSGQIDYLHRYGGSNDDDSSGSMRYVSVRHGGKKLTTDKEINGWSLCGVGRGTVADYLEAYCIADDGFEFFGGSVNTKHLVSAFNDDDGFDTDMGYNGQNQFWFGIQESTAKDSGSEQNGQPQSPDVRVAGALPLSNYTIRNATLIGAGTNTTANDALRFRQENKARWYNSVITDFGGVRVRIDDDGVSTPDVKNNVFWGFKSGSNEDYGKEYVPAALNPVADPKLRSISRAADGKLDPRPTPGSPVFEGAMSTPTDGFWTPVDYKGAFDGEDNWAYGWTGLSADGFFPARDNVFYVSTPHLYGTYNWSATNVYILTGFTYVMSNAVLNIEPGTVVKGLSGSGSSTSAANDFGCLFVCRGGKVNANGTPNNPIIFTAENDDVSDAGDLPFPTRGLWGGIVLFGNARLNNPGWTTNNVSYDIYEGLPDLAVTNALTGQIDYLHRFGGTDDNDSSGIFRYVSVRHGGKKLTTDKEINGWSLCGVGRSTVADYLEAYCIADDGFEFFGGSVNTKHLVAAFCDDDGFDTDQGYNGLNQFWFGIQEPGAKDSGSEQNGQPQSPDVRVPGALPLANYLVRNATMIGAGTNSSANDALRFRQENKARWYNSVITDFGGVRVRIDDDGVSTPDVKNNVFWGFKSGSNEDYGKEYVPANSNQVVDPLLGGISRKPDGQLDPTLRAGSPAYGVPQTDTPGLTTVNFTGAFGSENWAQDWTAMDAAGFFKATSIKPVGPSLLDLVPVAKSQAVSTAEDATVAVTLTGTDPQSDTLTYTIVTAPALGSLSGTAPNLVYTPRANANGTDSFTFKVNDGSFDSELATVAVTVTPVADAPIASNQDVSVRESTATVINLQAVDADGDAITYTVVSQPTLGVLSGTAPNLTYTPKLNAQGNDTFTFKVSDGALESAVVTVRITIGTVEGNVINVAAGYLYGTHNWVATNTYILTGFTYVMSNAVLNIEAGTVVKGASGTGTSTSAANDFGCLFVCAGGKLNANGTPNRPIIFTAVADDVSDAGDLPFPTRGLWGGIVLFGNARLNNPGWTTNNVSYDIYEGLPDLAVTNAVSGQVDYLHRYGGSNDDDSSGSMRYVSVRHGGKKLTTDKEINGWSLCGVGRGTVADYLEAYCIADDGFEFFGGSVNTKHLVSAFNDDDGFDTDMGYNGQNQFWFGIQESTAKDSGSEQNGQPQSPDVRVAGALPLSNYTIRNATLIGAGTNTTANDALRFRQENKARWYNSIVTGFGGVRVRIDDDGVSTPDVKNNLFWGFLAGSNEDYGKEYVPAALNPVADPKLLSISRKPDGKLDPRLSAGSPAFTGTMSTPADGFWTPADYKGAFDANDNWAYGWTGLSAEGFFPARDNVVYVDSNYLYGTYDWVATNTYILTGFTYVMSNSVLNIEPGTVIKGVSGTGSSSSAANDFGCLFVCRGGKINAAGTAGNPIIFTAEVDDVSDAGDLPFPTRGLWGGIVLFGNARLNNPGWTTNNVSYDIYEGLPDLAVTNDFTGQIDYLHRYGGTDDDDSSGVFRYVSVRHGGKKLTTDKEINGWSLCGVGRGTVADYLEAYCIADDGFEFFGGSVNTKHLVAAFCDDDGFDTDQGYNGRNQFWFGIQEPGAKDSGSEQNGQPQSPDVRVPGALPLANYVVRNATMIGAGTNSSGNDALRFRQENKARWFNSVFTDFGGVRVRIDDDGVSTPELKNNVFWGYKTGSNEDYGKEYVPADLNPTVDPLLGGISRKADGQLDPTLRAGSPAYGVPQTETPGFVKVNFTGAFGSENWAQDWTALDADGFFKATSIKPVGPIALPQPKAPILGVAATATGLKITFMSEPGRTYILQSRTALDQTAWTPVQSPVVGTGSDLTVEVPFGVATGFVRISVE